MEAVAILRDLWRRRLVVAVVAVIALLIGLQLAFRISPPFTLKSRTYHVGIASTTALVDTPASQVVDLGDSSDNSAAAALPGRAMLLANLITTSPLKDEIARQAGINPRTLIATMPSDTGTAAGGGQTASLTGATVSASDPRASTLTVQTFEGLPMLAVQTQAPTAAAAARLSDGAIHVLEVHVNSLAGTDRVPAGRRLVVKQLGAARVATVQRGPSRMLALIAAMFVFMLGCAAILGVTWLTRTWYDAAELETLSEDEYLYDEPEPELEGEPQQNGHVAHASAGWPS
jgi:hypothetical protein